MDLVRRVTLRCLVEDLSSGWTDVRQQRGFSALRGLISREGISDGEIAFHLTELPTTSLASHPLVASFHASFASSGDEVQRESISGLANPHWWKQKVSRWRGAATDSETIQAGEAWLCAGGLRAGKDARDFYVTFTSRVAHDGPECFLPAEEDTRLKTVESKILRKDAWLAQVRLSVLIAVAQSLEAGKSVYLHIPSPSPSGEENALLHLSVEVTSLEVDGEKLVEAILGVDVVDPTKPALALEATVAARTVLEQAEDSWKLSPGLDQQQIWSSLLSIEAVSLAREALESEELPERVRNSSTQLAVQAHFAQKSRLVEAMVEGDPVRSLCGRWFVPTADSESRPVCAVCSGVYKGLPE